VALGLFGAEDEDADRDEDEGEERANVGHLGEGADVEQAAGYGDEDAGDDGGEGRCAKAGVEFGEGVGQEFVARHGEPNARLAVLANEDGRDHACEGSDEDKQTDVMQTVAAGFEREALEGVDDGRAIVGDGLPGNDAGEDQRDSEIEDGADDERGEDSNGHVALGVAAFFACGGDGVEADVGEEDDGAAGEDS